ncbi:lipase 1 [Tribolium castaneum]|uniref:Lipase n=1 Tax=Tribolium castaneum TaxID=7070 RepID=D2A309_TRICA|nr:PREDICTED: lipase 1 [Tribolium castaneum]EFA02251.1 Lipase 1-like Protein [Tribolium castaneum]|eukprot:XP_973324.1 PREDICTED: lipase 1 [Tribolium castaneum]
MKPSANFLLIVVCVLPNCAADFWEYFIGPRLSTGNGSERAAPKVTDQLVRSYGYRLDTHLVASQTGHILTLHRIPRGRKAAGTKPRPVAFIHHGLFGCSDMWLSRGPHLDLPYILADSGYDVWLFNTRGNVYSRKHKSLDPDRDAEYWNFGIEEMGYYDLPVTIDYILNITNQKDLFYLGHSIGSSTGFITCSLRPEYNSKIRLFMALGPLAHIRHPLNLLHKVLFSLLSPALSLVESMNIYEIWPRRFHISRLVEAACEDGSPFQKLCLMLIFSVVGEDPTQLNTTTFPNFVQYYPAGTSLKVVSNIVQYYVSGEFARFSGGKTVPFIYDLAKVTAPVALYYGPGDLLVTQEDVDYLSHRLGNVTGKFRIPYKHFNHLDFVLANNARSLLYNNLLSVMEKYK